VPAEPAARTRRGSRPCPHILHIVH
jgi:hypothetical protein